MITGALWHGHCCGITAWAIAGIKGWAVATGAQVAQGEIGAHGAGAQLATGDTYVGGQAGITVVGRLNQLHGQHGHNRPMQQPEAAGNTATASKISNFFMILSSPSEAVEDYCFGHVV